jgi:hypothetical protein
MASNFRIFSHRNSDNLHLKLMGDFDGSSAFELANLLNRHQNSTRKIFIHTSNVSSVHPFGQAAFQKDRTVKNLSNSLTFTGQHGRTLAPEGSTVL